MSNSQKKNQFVKELEDYKAQLLAYIAAEIDTRIVQADSSNPPPNPPPPPHG